MVIILLILLLFSILIYLILDHIGPEKITLKAGTAFNLECSRVRDLIVQGSDNNGNIWASRGMKLYRMKEGGDHFTRVAHVPTGFSFFWFNNFSLFRSFTNKPECLEATISINGDICALSAGYIWHRTAYGIKFKTAMKLPHYGFGVGRGIFSNGLLAAGDGRVFFGEYFRNTERGPVKIFRSCDSGQTWDIAFEFAPGTIRHIHALQEDPFTGRLWICTGDRDEEAFIGWSDNDFKNINRIGKGSQIWRTCQLVFTKEAVCWGTDTGSEELAGIYRWDREKMETTKLKSSKGAILYGTKLSGGTIIFSTDREGFPNEKDLKTRIFVINRRGGISEFEFGTWKHFKKGFGYSFAMLRIQRNQGDKALYISLINQKELSIGEMLIFSEEILNTCT